ncbi:UNVERIFIED_CONTAM: hypothetical protein Sindi_1647600 [Sesamum indicum]
MAREADEKSDHQEDRERYLRLERFSTCWEQTREELKGANQPTSELKGDQIFPCWNISASSSVLFSGQDSWDLFDACILPRDQASLLVNTPTRIEEHGAHAQTATFFRSLSMKCASYRWNQIAVDARVGELSAQLAERDRMDRTHVEEMQTLNEEVQKLKSDAGREVGLIEGRKEGFQSGHAQEIKEGQVGRVTLEEHHQALTNARVSVARDFLKSGLFKTAVEIKSADFFNKGYKTCEAQLETLGGFADSFDRSRMDITLDGKLQSYPEEPAPADDEFSVLLDEIEPNP